METFLNKIAEADNGMLATLSAKVMRNLVRYAMDRHGQLSKRRPFIDELDESPVDRVSEAHGRH